MVWYVKDSVLAKLNAGYGKQEVYTLSSISAWLYCCKRFLINCESINTYV